MFERIFIFVLLGVALGNSSSSKIDASLRQVYQSRSNTKANIFVSMTKGTEETLHRVNSRSVSLSLSRTANINTIKVELESLASTSQKGVLSIVEKNKVKYTSFWISNEVFIPDAPWALVQLLEQDPQVASIRQEETYELSNPVVTVTSTDDPNNPPWGIRKIEAPQAWELDGGSRGEGVIIAAIDTGARFTHEALRDNYRNDNFSWYDPYDKRRTPVDSDGHGTHVLGTIIGTTGTGVAPGAQWIACRGCKNRTCTESALISCGQWILCPTRPDGTGHDCSKAPHLVSNSLAGGQGQTSYLPIVNAWHSAGIIPIFAIGNTGHSCRTAQSPGDLDNVIGVGSTDSDDRSSPFTSLGPTVNGKMKPDISAPGSDVYSAWIYMDTMYVHISGTSMAAPHVSGVVALLLGMDRNLTYDRIKRLLQSNTDKELVDVGGCGGISSNIFPNHVYGHGRLNARRSCQALLDGEEDGSTTANDDGSTTPKDDVSTTEKNDDSSAPARFTFQIYLTISLTFIISSILY